MRFVFYTACMPTCHDHDLEQTLRKAQLKVTPARVAVLSILIHDHGPFSTQEILEKLPKNFCDQATVFRTLKTLKEKGIVKDVIFDSDRIYYEFHHPDHHHHHIVCTKCERKQVLDQCDIETLQQEATRLGFTMTDHRIELFGLCSKCQ